MNNNITQLNNKRDSNKLDLVELTPIGHLQFYYFLMYLMSFAKVSLTALLFKRNTSIHMEITDQRETLKPSALPKQTESFFFFFESCWSAEFL